MAINNFSLLQPNQPLTATDKLLADINNFNNTVVPNLPPPPPVNVPKYTKFGDNLATLGGFGDQPNELLAQEQLAKMTQDQVDAYNQQRKKARTQGIGELLMRFGDALQGKNASQLAYGRKQVRNLAQLESEYQNAIKIAEASGDYGKANLLRTIGATGYQGLQIKAAEEKLKNTGQFSGTSLDAQYLNFLEKGKNDAEFRKSTQYRVAYNQLTRPKTSTYINESGQPVTRTVPGLDPSIYPAPTSTGVNTPPPDTTGTSTDTTTKDGGITETVGITAERRKLVEKDIDVVDGVVDKLNDLEDGILRIDPGVLTFGKELAEIDSLYNSVLLELKNYAELGVLAGPDLDLLENWIGNPTSIKQALKGGNEGTLLQLRQLRAAAMKVKNKGLKELGQDPVEIKTQNQPKKYYKNGREITVSQDGSQWVYKDDGTPAQ